jgi:hypothetical protein
MDVALTDEQQTVVSSTPNVGEVCAFVAVAGAGRVPHMKRTLVRVLEKSLKVFGLCSSLDVYLHNGRRKIALGETGSEQNVGNSGIMITALLSLQSLGL